MTQEYKPTGITDHEVGEEQAVQADEVPDSGKEPAQQVTQDGGTFENPNEGVEFTDDPALPDSPRKR